MLELKHINISFKDHIVFDDAFFKASPGELTLLCGKSGTGKSTLIDALLCKHQCEYLYNNNIIDIQNCDEYIYQNISIVYQLPCFYEELTIEEHIHFIMELYGIDDNQDSLLDILKIRNLLHKFPKQLSGGEQTRCSLFLSILKQPNILILDEPTAALDKDNKDSVIDFIKQYAHQGHIVIASSHDQSLIDHADILYTIENKKLIKDIKYENSITNNALSYHKNNQIFLKYIGKSLIHQKLYKKFLYILLSFSIAFLMIAFSFNNYLIAYTNSQLDNLSSKEIIVSKNPFIDNSYSYNGSETPMTLEDYQIISNIENVESINWRFDLTITKNFDVDDIGNENSIDESSILTGYASNEMISSFDCEGYSMMFSTYLDDKDYSSYLLESFSNESNGIYITEELYNNLFNDNDNTSKELEFMLPIPIYNTSGSVEVTIENDDGNTVISANEIKCHYVTVKLPINGVISGTSLGVENSYDGGIYVSQSLLLEYYNDIIDDYPDSRTLYWITSKPYVGSYINEYPSDYTLTESDYVVEQTKWTTDSATALSVEVENHSQLEEVVSKLEELGYNVESEYLDTNAYLNIENNTQSTFTTVSLVMFVVVFALYLYIQYISHIEEKNTQAFLSSLGIDKSNKSLFFIKKYARPSDSLVKNIKA